MPDFDHFSKAEYLPGLTPGEAKWNLDKLTKLRMAVVEQVSSSKADQEQVKAAIASNSINLAPKLPKSLQSQLNTLRRRADKLAAMKDYLNGINEVLSITEAKLKTVDSDLREAKGFVWGAYKHTPGELQFFEAARGDIDIEKFRVKGFWESWQKSSP
jgi:hypothetical protein